MTRLKHILKRIGMFALASFVVLLTVWTVLNIIFGIQLRHTIAELKRQGFHFSWEEIQPAKVPDEDNAAIPLRRAADMLGKWGMGNDLTSKNLYPNLNRLAEIVAKCSTNHPGGMDIETWPAAVRAELPQLVESKEMDELYGYVSKAAERKRMKLGIKYSDGINALLPNIGGFRQILRCLAVKAQVENGAGKTDQAFETLLIAQKAVAHMDAEPCLICHLVRRACDRIVIDTVQRIANNAGCSEELAKNYMAEISKSLARQTREKCIDMEIYMMATVFEGMLSLDEKIIREFPVNGKKSIIPYKSFFFTLRPLLKKDFCFYLSKSARTRKYFTAPYYEVAADIKRMYDEKIPKSYFLSQNLYFRCGSMLKISACDDAKVEVCRTGLALQIYKMRHGKYPDKLEQLAPDILPAVPADPLTGKSLVYKPEGEGFLLYSVGANLADDHGDETWDADAMPRDIVWRCPR